MTFLPHCTTCSCTAPPPAAASGVNRLPGDWNRVHRYTVGRGNERRAEEMPALDCVHWVPERSATLPQRVAHDGGAVRARVQAVALAIGCWAALLPLAAYRGLL